MVDSQMVLSGQALIYTFYVLAIISLMSWFAYRVTQSPVSGKTPSGVSSKFFYSFVAVLIGMGVSIHLITYNTIPWAALDLKRAQIKPDKVFNIHIQKHQFHLPSEKLLISQNDKVLFNVASADLTYGFGLFREDHSMLFQMQVVPGHNNDLLWEFNKPGIYTIRSTEYSGPRGVEMVVKNAVVVTATGISQGRI